MKRCPQCNRVESDESLKFCRADGVTLVNDSSSIGSEAGTAQSALREQAQTEYVSAINIAKIYAGLGERELVFEWLEKAFEERAVRMPWFMIDPALDDFRDDPRFADVLKRIGLPH